MEKTIKTGSAVIPNSFMIAISGTSHGVDLITGSNVVVYFAEKKIKD